MKGAGPPLASPAGSKHSGAQAGDLEGNLKEAQRAEIAVGDVKDLSAPFKVNQKHMWRE